jgi:hypothetical protein
MLVFPVSKSLCRRVFVKGLMSITKEEDIPFWYPTKMPQVPECLSTKMHWHGHADARNDFVLAVIGSSTVPDKEMVNVFEEKIGRILADDQGLELKLTIVTANGKPFDSIVAKLCEEKKINNLQVSGSAQHRPEMMRFLVSWADWVMLFFDGEDNDVVYALGECYEQERPHTFTQDRPTKPKHYVVEALMRGLRAQERERLRSGKAKAMGQAQDGN